MLVLYETAAGYAIFRLENEKKLKNVDNIWDEFNTAEKAQDNLQLISLKKFKTTAEAVEATNAQIEGTLSKTLKKALKGKITEGEKLAVGDAKLGNLIKEKLNIACVHNSSVDELMRGIRTHVDTLLGEHKAELNAMNLALSHSLGRFKVKFNPEKIDTMIVQAVSLLDDLDKELNNYVMRLREWYGWHFPEVGKIIQDHQAFAKVVKAIGMRQNAINIDLSSILPEELEAKVKEEAEISMGTDISELDLINIHGLCDEVINLTEYRAQLFDYLKNRMSILAPNLTCLLGELVGARLISHAGSLMSLAKAPASTIQILGAEKALFRALKSKKDTPKYGLIYHAQLITQAPAHLKGKIARKLAAKCALSTRIDALGDEQKSCEVGMEARASLENALRTEQERGSTKISGNSKIRSKYTFKNNDQEYDASADVPKKAAKHKFEDDDDYEQKPDVKRAKIEPMDEGEAPTSEKKKKKKSKKADDDDE